MGAALLTARRGPTLVVAALLAVLATAGLEAQDTTGVEDPHGDVGCADCHTGDEADREVGAVPAATCTGSDCHPDAGPGEVRVSTVVFDHRNHGDTAAVQLGCAGCHVHESGEEPIRPTLDACGLCHADQLSGDDPAACMDCHQEPEHVPTTNQGVPVPHDELPWIREGCVRCHYDVSRPRSEVSIRTCGDCHDDVDRVAEEGIGTDLHPSHAGVSCTTCHEPDAHDVVAMSSAVALECGSCHRRSHAIPVDAPALPGTRVCVDCHRETHADQQRLVLGIVEGVPVTPSYKYLSGLACGTCHSDAAGEIPSDRALGGRAEACVACHRPEYRQVLTWWGEGARQRARRVRDYVSRARRTLGSPDTVEALLDRSGAYVDLVERTGAQHNLAFSDRLLRLGVELTGDAYRVQGRRVPPGPDLGRRPRVGFCSYCHYRIGEPADFQEMPEDFHQAVEARFEELRERERQRGRERGERLREGDRGQAESPAARPDTGAADGGR